MSIDQWEDGGLAEELHELGRAIDVPARDSEAVADQVMRRLGERERDVGALWQHRWRPVAAVAAGVLVVLALTPPVRAAVTEWFGVIITDGEPAESADVPVAGTDLSLAQASDLVTFDPVVPDLLVDTYGPPVGASVSGGGRVLAFSWPGPAGTIRLDQFDGEMAPVFLKHGEPEVITIGGRSAIWIGGPHYLAPLDADGREYPGMARDAVPTLIWQVGDITLRLEGMDRAAAIAVARSSADTG